jgi:hypothetical protein
MRELDKDKKVFLAVGLPIFVFLTIFYATHYFQITAFFLIILGIAFGALFRIDRIYMRLTKIGLLTFVVYVIMFSNFLQLPNQFVRRMPGGRQALLEPNHPKVVQFQQDFYDWHEVTYGVNFSDVDESTREKLAIKLYQVDNYTRKVRMKYQYDIYPPYLYYDHLPTIDEIFASDIDGDGKLNDDCDGITILTVSLLLSMGYNAYVAEVEFHYHTKVFAVGINPKTTEGYVQAINLYSWGNDPAYLLFNETELFVPPTEPIYTSFINVLFAPKMWESYYLGVFTGDYFTIPIYVLIPALYVICFLLAILITYYGKVGFSLKHLDKKERRKKFWRTTFINSLLCSVLIGALFVVSFYGFAFLGNITLGIGLITVFRFTDFKMKRISEQNR